MAYVSPLHIVKGIGDDDAAAKLTPDYLLRARKRLLAELNLSGENSILLAGKVYTKDTIIKTIDQLLQITDLELHDFIYHNSFLLNYLEDESILMDIDAYAELTIPDSIRQQLDTLLSERFVLQFRKGIGSRKFAMAERALVGMNFLESNLRFACYEEVHRALVSFYNFLWELKQKVNRHSKTHIEFLSYPSLAVFLNALPDSFADVKQHIITCIISIVNFYNSLSNHQHDLVIGISNVLMMLECTEEQSALIRSNHQRFRYFQESEYLWPPSPPASDSITPALANLDFRAFLWVIVAIFCAIILRGLFDNSSSYNAEKEYTNSKRNDMASHRPSVTTTLYHFRNDVVQFLATLPEVRTSYFINSIYPVPGLAPLKDPKFFTYQADFNNCDKTLNIKNSSGYDLIVFEYDSIQNGLRSLYVPKHLSEKISFNAASRFVFYFGNGLSIYNIPKFNSLAEHEFFAEVHTHSRNILLNDYIIRTTAGKDVTEYTLTLNPEFLDKPTAEYSSENVSLTRIEQF